VKKEKTAAALEDKKEKKKKKAKKVKSSTPADSIFDLTTESPSTSFTSSGSGSDSDTSESSSDGEKRGSRQLSESSSSSSSEEDKPPRRKRKGSMSPGVPPKKAPYKQKLEDAVDALTSEERKRLKEMARGKERESRSRVSAELKKPGRNSSPVARNSMREGSREVATSSGGSGKNRHKRSRRN